MRVTIKKMAKKDWDVENLALKEIENFSEVFFLQSVIVESLASKEAFVWNETGWLRSVDWIIPKQKLSM